MSKNSFNNTDLEHGLKLYALRLFDAGYSEKQVQDKLIDMKLQPELARSLVKELQQEHIRKKKEKGGKNILIGSILTIFSLVFSAIIFKLGNLCGFHFLSLAVGAIGLLQIGIGIFQHAKRVQS